MVLPIMIQFESNEYINKLFIGVLYLFNSAKTINWNSCQLPSHSYNLPFLKSLVLERSASKWDIFSRFEET